MILPLCFCLSACLSLGRVTRKNRRQILVIFLELAGYVNSNSWLDLGDDPDHDADTGIFKGNFYEGGVTHLLQDERQVKDWHRLYDDILRCRRVLLQTGIVKYPAHEEVGFLRSAFYRLLIFLSFAQDDFYWLYKRTV